MVKKLAWKAFRIAFIAGIFIYLYRTGHLDFRKLESLRDGMGLFFFSGLLMLAGALFAVERWRVLVRAQNRSLGFCSAVKLTFLGFFFGAVLPGTVSGDIVKAYYITRGEEKKTELVTPIVFDRLLGLYTLIFISALAASLSFMRSVVSGSAGVWAHPYVQGIGAFIALLFVSNTMIGVLFMSRRLRDSSFMGGLLPRLPFSATLTRVYDSVLNVSRRPAIMLKAFSFSLIAQLFTYAGIFCLTLIFHINTISLAEYLFVLPVCSLVNAIPIAPGGLGVGEAGFRAVFLLFGSSEGAEVAFLFHALFFMLAIGLGGLVYLFSDYSKDKTTDFIHRHTSGGDEN